MAGVTGPHVHAGRWDNVNQNVYGGDGPYNSGGGHVFWNMAR